MKVFEIKCQLKKVFAMWCRRAAPWVAYGLLVKCDALCFTLITVCLDARIIVNLVSLLLIRWEKIGKKSSPNV